MPHERQAVATRTSHGLAPCTRGSPAAHRHGGGAARRSRLAPFEPAQFEADVAAVRDGGVVVSTTAFIATPGDGSRHVRAATVFVRPDRDRLKQLVALVDAGELTVEVTRRISLIELPALHAEAETGRIAGKVVVLP